MKIIKLYPEDEFRLKGILKNIKETPQEKVELKIFNITEILKILIESAHTP